MSKSNAFELEFLSLIFNNEDIALIGDASGIQNSATTGSLYVSLHTGDPTEGGNQTSSECAYGSYARQAVARTAGGWTVDSLGARNAALISFPTASSGSETITHAGIGASSSGAGLLLYKASLAAQFVVSTGVTPQFQIGTIGVTED